MCWKKSGNGKMCPLHFFRHGNPGNYWIALLLLFVNERLVSHQRQQQENAFWGDQITTTTPLFFAGKMFFSIFHKQLFWNKIFDRSTLSSFVCEMADRALNIEEWTKMTDFLSYVVEITFANDINWNFML